MKDYKEQEFCQSCQAMLCGCNAKEEDKTYNEKGEIIACKMYMDRIHPGYCVNCESGGRL